jgi:Ulp1 family protease
MVKRAVPAIKFLLDNECIGSLAPGAMLHDDVITHFLSHYIARYPEVERNKIEILPPTVTTTFANQTLDQTAADLMGLNLDTKRFVLAVIHNAPDLHWSMIILDRERKVFHFDSSAGRQPNEKTNYTVAWNVSDRLVRALMVGKRQFAMKPVPIQNEGTNDCGLHVLETAKTTFHHMFYEHKPLNEVIDRPVTYSQNHFDLMRRELIQMLTIPPPPDKEKKVAAKKATPKKATPKKRTAKKK